MQHEQNGFLNNDFRTCLATLMAHGVESHPRGTTTKELLNYNITLLAARNRVITFADRKTNLKYLLGEFIWYLTGENTINGILPYSKFWSNITNSGDFDGYPKGTINSNYGNRLFARSDLDAFWEGNIQPINQWQETLELLKRDKDTRQAIMNIHVPSDRHVGNKDVPCTLSLQWFIRENSLHLIVNMRSNDIILGFTNDVFQFTMLQECMLLDLRNHYPDLEMGHYFHNAGSMHIYDRHFDMANKIIIDERAVDFEMIPMDVFNSNIIHNLQVCKTLFESAGQPEDFDWSNVEQFDRLSPYWKLVVNGFFSGNSDALHELMKHDHESHE